MISLAVTKYFLYLMDQHDPIKPVAATVATFRSINQDGKSEEEYQGTYIVPSIASTENAE
jgi:L-lysine 2,3-aminomutase